MKEHDVVIIGGGCSGLKTAEELAKKGVDVLLLEKNKEIGYKVCAGGLTKKALELCSFPNKIIQREFNKIIVRTPLQKTVIRMKKPFIATVDMADMHRHMANKARKAGARIQVNSNVTKIKENSVIVNNKTEIRFNYLVGADGSHSVVRKHLGLESRKILSAFQYITPKRFEDFEVYFDFDKFGPAYAWIFPYKNSTSIGTGGDLTKKGQKLKRISDVKNNLNSWCRSLCDLRKARFEGFTINYDYQGYEFGNKFLAGDAGGFASGLTGEGMYFAMLSGIDIANKILNNDYPADNIKHVLKIKKKEAWVLRQLEINKTFTKIEFELLALLLKIKWIDKKLIEKID